MEELYRQQAINLIDLINAKTRKSFAYDDICRFENNKTDIKIRFKYRTEALVSGEVEESMHNFSFNKNTLHLTEEI